MLLAISATSVYLCEGNTVTRLARHPVTQSLGTFYSLITQFLGYAFNEDEYKVDGPRQLWAIRRAMRISFRSAIRLIPNGGVEIPWLTVNRGFAEGLWFTASAAAIERGLGIDGKNCALQVRGDIRAALQQRFTEALFHICNHFQKQTQATDLLLSGGCAENCAAIGELRSNGMFERIHVAYASGDEGTALGAAAACVSRKARRCIPGVMPFFGPAPQRATVRAIIAQHPELTLCEFDAEQPMLRAAAGDLAADRIVALCNGRMEFGARALGNRNLLALPSNAANRIASTWRSRSGRTTVPSRRPLRPRMRIGISF